MESKYERIRRIGIGSYGVVFKCINRHTGQVVAIKRYSENDSDPVIRKIAMREVRLLRKLKHQNLIHLFEVFRRKRRLHLVLEYCELTLLDVIEKYTNTCPLSLIKRIIWQLINGLNYCHLHNCIHRDIKPENVLICKCGTVKLCDFGFARHLTRSSATSQASQASYINSSLVDHNNISNNSIGKASSSSSSSSSSFTSSLSTTKQSPKATTQNNGQAPSSSTPVNILLSSNNVNKRRNDIPQINRVPLTEYVATRWYRAPELLIGDVHYGTKIDIWALGCVTCELMRGEPLWPGKTDLDQLNMIKASLGQLTAHQASVLTTQAIYEQPIIERILVPQKNIIDPLEFKIPQRVGKLGVDFIMRCMKMDENLRDSCTKLLEHPFVQPSSLSTLNVQQHKKTNVKMLQQQSHLNPQSPTTQTNKMTYKNQHQITMTNQSYDSNPDLPKTLEDSSFSLKSRLPLASMSNNKNNGVSRLLQQQQLSIALSSLNILPEHTNNSSLLPKLKQTQQVSDKTSKNKSLGTTTSTNKTFLSSKVLQPLVSLTTTTNKKNNQRLPHVVHNSVLQHSSRQVLPLAAIASFAALPASHRHKATNSSLDINDQLPPITTTNDAQNSPENMAMSKLSKKTYLVNQGERYVTIVESSKSRRQQSLEPSSDGGSTQKMPKILDLKQQ